jgi:hypothetical protein
MLDHLSRRRTGSGRGRPAPRFRPELERLDDRRLPSMMCTVTNTNDSGPGSLRQAILDANHNPGLDTITFAIPGAGPHVITPGATNRVPTGLGALPQIIDPVVINGYTQPGAVPATGNLRATLGVVLDGSRAGPNAVGLDIEPRAAGTSTVEGLVIQNFTSDGLFIQTPTAVVVQGNYIGTDVTGTSPRGNGSDGILALSPQLTVGGTTPDLRNVISGNGGVGVVFDLAGGGVVEGNRIGTDATGTTPLGNGSGGILGRLLSDVVTVGGAVAGAGNVISANGGVGIAIGHGVVQGNYVGTDATGAIPLGNAGDGVEIDCGTVGGTVAGARNVISANHGAGVVVYSSGPTVVQGNYIGTNASGTARLGNGGDGVSCDGVATIGGTVAGARNVISANHGNGIELGIDGVVVEGNYVGTDATGTAPLGNAGNGVVAHSFVSAMIGGTAAGAGNVISANGGHGLVIEFGIDGVVVQGNDIGTDATGTAPLGNAHSGVVIEGFCTVGGAAAGAGNVIAFNGTATSSPGVALMADPTFDRVAILSNRIFANGRLGIDRDNDGVTPNEQPPIPATAPPGDTANFPVLSWVANVGEKVYVTGSLYRAANTTFLVQFFTNRTPDPTGYGEGETYLGSTTVTTDSSGNATFWTGPMGSAVPAGLYVSATATPLNAAGVTSEFSQDVLERVGSIAGRQFHDLNGNGARDPGEPGLTGWTVYLDKNNNGQYDTGELTAATDPLGDYLFPLLSTGTYTVREKPQKGWGTSAPAAGYYTAVVGAGQGAGGLDFGVYHPATITGHVFNDLNADGMQENGDLGLPGRIVFVDLNNSGKPDPGEPSATTDSLGNYRITGLRPGTYILREYLPSGWRHSLPAGGSYRLTLTSGQVLAGEDFGDYQPVSISGQVFWDTNANHVKDPGEPGLAGWVVYLDANNNGVLDPGEATATTDSTGHYVFTGLTPGTYIVREVIPAPAFQQVWVQSLPTAGFYAVTLTSGQSATDRDFGNVALYLGP